MTGLTREAARLEVLAWPVFLSHASRDDGLYMSPVQNSNYVQCLCLPTMTMRMVKISNCHTYNESTMTSSSRAKSFFYLREGCVPGDGFAIEKGCALGERCTLWAQKSQVEQGLDILEPCV